MASAEDVLRVATGELGYSRWDDPEAGTKYGRWYAEQVGDSYYGESGVPYCAMFVSWCLHQAGIGDFTYAYCPYILRDYSGHLVYNEDAQPGDIVLFNWDGGEVDHVGFVELNKGSYFQTIEGNTNNGCVARRTRSFGVVGAVIRPPFYDAASTGPSNTIPEQERAVYRLYDPNSGNHLFTASHAEAQNVADAGWSYEGVAWTDSGEGDVFRLYNPDTGEHMLTVSAGEHGSLTAAGWECEGNPLGSGVGAEVFRLYDGRLHMFTASEAERDALVAAGWKDEGVAFLAG